MGIEANQAHEGDYIVIRIAQVEDVRIDDNSSELHPIPFIFGLLCVVGMIMATVFIGIKVICLVICSV